MPSFTFKESKKCKPIAYIKGGRFDGEVLYINPEDEENKVDYDELDYSKHFLEDKPRDRAKKLSLLIRALKKGVEPLEDDILEAYTLVNKTHSKNSNKEIKLHDGQIFPIPDPNSDRQVVYAYAPSGAGKSTWVANYCKEWKKLFPKNDIFVFSRLESDDVIDKLKPHRVMLDETLITDPIDTVKDIPDGSLVIFDDTDSLTNKLVKKEVDKIKDDILQTGRHNKIYCLITSHLGSNYKETRVILNEAHTIVFFPSSGSWSQTKYVLDKYVGLDKKDIMKMKTLPSRWVAVYKNYPQFCLYQTGAYLFT